MIDEMEQYRRNRINYAVRGSMQATARYAGMKIRARMDPPTAAPAHFPYRDHRRCDQQTPWERRRG